jgi:predicted membrane metal-binding protein
LSLFFFLCLFACLALCLFVCLFVCLSVCLFVCLFFCRSFAFSRLSVLFVNNQEQTALGSGVFAAGTQQVDASTKSEGPLDPVIREGPALVRRMCVQLNNKAAPTKHNRQTQDTTNSQC